MNLEDYDFDRLLALGYTEKATGDLKKACWKGYTAIGTKKKGGRVVPNCVPIKKSEHSESEDFRQIQMGGDLLVDVECDTNLPLSTPAELREAKMRKRVAAAQNKAQRQEAREQAKHAREAKRASREAKRMQQGFAEEMKRKPFIAGPSAGSPSFAERAEEVLDFTRCVRPDGSSYGTSGKCRKGTEQAKEEKEIPKRTASDLLNKAEEYDWSTDSDFEDLHNLIVDAYNSEDDSMSSGSAYEALANGLNAKFPKLKLTGEKLEELDKDEEIWDQLDGYAHGNYGAL